MSLREATFVIWILNVVVAGLLALPFGLASSVAWVAAGWAMLLAMCIPMAIAEAFNTSRETRLRSRLVDLCMLIGFLGLFWLSVVAFPFALALMWLYNRGKDAAIHLGYPKP